MNFKALLLTAAVAATGFIAAPEAQAGQKFNALTNADGSCKTGYAYSNHWERCVHPVDLTESDKANPRAPQSNAVANWLLNNVHCPTATYCHTIRR